MKRVVVVGGGISGLAAAWTAQRTARLHGADIEVVVLEREAEVGGKARTISRDGWLLEAGPSGFLSGRPEMERLVDAAGLRDVVVSARPAADRRFVHRGGATREIARHPMGFLQSRLLTARGRLRMLAEPLVQRHRGGEESVWAFSARRFGREFADGLIDPMMLGIFAGNARDVSLDAAFPWVRALEREHRSLILAMFARRGRTGRALTSFRDGMQRLPRALAERGGFRVRCKAVVRAVTRANEQWRVWLDGGGDPLDADALVLAGEPWAMAELLAPHDDALGAELRAIRCPPVSVVALGYAPPAAVRVPLGFGVLLARGEGFRMLGNLWETHLYPERSPEGHVLVKAMFGGSADAAAGTLDEPALLSLAHAEVNRLYGIADDPVFAHVVRWPHAIPQYEMGHLDRVARIERAVAALPNAWITGFGLRGVAFADAASGGIRTGEAVARGLIQARADPANRT